MKMKTIKNLASMLIIIGFSLTQTACMRCCVTTDLIKRIDNESKQPPKTVRYIDRIEKVIGAYINDEEKELTICVGGKLAEKTTTQQFALKTSLNIEQLKNQPPKGIKYELKEGKIPTIQMERHTVIHYCPEQPTNTRTLMTANFNVDQDSSLLGRKIRVFDLVRTVEEKLASVYIKNSEQERDFISKNPDKFQNITPIEISKLLQPIQEKSDSVLYVSMDKPRSQYLVYTNYPPLTVQIGGGIGMAAPKPINKDSPLPENQTTYVYQEEPIIHVYNPEKFDGKHFVVFKIKEEEKVIPNTPRESYFAVPSAIILDMLLIPSYLLTAVLCPKYCRPM